MISKKEMKMKGSL